MPIQDTYAMLLNQYKENPPKGQGSRALKREIDALIELDKTLMEFLGVLGPDDPASNMKLIIYQNAHNWIEDDIRIKLSRK